MTSCARILKRVRPVLLFILFLVLAVSPVGCNGCRGPETGAPVPPTATPGSSTPPAGEPGTGVEPPAGEDPYTAYVGAWTRPAKVTAESGGYRITLPEGQGVFFSQDPGYAPVAVRPAVVPYTVKPDLSNLANLQSFAGLSPEQRRYLAENMFVAAQSQDEQLFFVYDANKYRQVPSFYTTDVFLQLYHLIYDFALRDMELLFLKPAAEELTVAMLQRSVQDYAAAKDPLVKAASCKNAAYFATAAALLGVPPASLPGLPGDARALADRETALVMAHAGRLPSALFPWQLDYTQFIPRGHYTRTPELESYFRAMMWYGLAPFPARCLKDGQEVRADEQLVQALLMARATADAGVGALWEKIYEPTVFFVGKTDDLSMPEARRMMAAIWGSSPQLDALADGASLDRLVAEMEKPENQPRIKQVLEGIPTSVQFRFMGQRYLPDSEILQELSSWPQRPLPKGLDVPGVLGSARAENLLFDLYREPDAWPDYAVKFPRLQQQFAALPGETWRSNLYHGWLWALGPLVAEKPAGAPAFMRSAAWPAKALETYLGSWSELRHDTLLYGKAMAAEAGDGWEITPQYVEPEPEFFNRLTWLVNQTGCGLAARGLLTEKTASVLAGFRDELVFVRDVAERELTAGKLSEDELNHLRDLGGVIERLSISTIGPYGHWGNLLSDVEKHMAVIADVGTSGGTCLEVGVGPAKHIYVVFPFDGKLYIGRGAMFAYHEFQWPITDRLTDEAWQGMVKAGKAPEQQEWIRAYTIGQPVEPAEPAR